MEKETKQCPCCCEEIMASAIKCKHCGEWLDERAKYQHPGGLASNFPFKTWKVLRRYVIPIFTILVLYKKGLMQQEYGSEFSGCWVLAMFGILMGSMFFILSSYVRSVSNEGNTKFTMLAIWELLSSVLFLSLLFSLDELMDEDLFAIDITTGLINVTIYYLCSSALFRLGRQGIRGANLLGIYMLIYIILGIFMFVFTLLDNFESDGIFIPLTFISMICIMVQMRNLFNRYYKSRLYH